MLVAMRKKFPLSYYEYMRGTYVERYLHAYDEICYLLTHLVSSSAQDSGTGCWYGLQGAS